MHAYKHQTIESVLDRIRILAHFYPTIPLALYEVRIMYSASACLQDRGY